MGSLNDLSDAELEQVASGKLDGLSNDALQSVADHGATPEPSGALGGIRNYFAGKLNPNAVPADSESFSGNPVFEAIGRAGNSVNNGIQNATGFLADKAGRYLPGPIAGAAAAALTVPASLSQLLIPRDAEAAGTGALLGRMDPEAAMSVAPRGGAMMSPGAIPEVAGAKLAGGVVQPNTLQKIGGSVVTATTAIPERYTSAVMADPSILTTAETPAQVGKDYQAVFDKLGINYDSDFVKEISGKRYIPSENQASQGYKIVDDLLTKAEGMKPGEMAPSEAFMGRSVAASLKRSNQYAVNPTFKSVVDGAQHFFDNELEQSGFPEVKALGQRYFKAVAREHFESFLPQNKNLSPNALRSLVMLKLGGDALGQVAKGNWAGAAAKGLQSASMSPMVVGGAIRGLAVGPSISQSGIQAGRAALPLAENAHDSLARFYGKLSPGRNEK